MVVPLAAETCHPKWSIHCLSFSVWMKQKQEAYRQNIAN